MLDIILEFRKGILFIRLKGVITKNTTFKLKEEVVKIINDSGINHIVFNLEETNYIDMKGISNLFYIYEIAKKNNGICYICSLNEKIKNKIKNSRLLNYIYEIETELDVLQKI